MKPFDAIVIGTGFAGAVTACRLVQANQKICILERGRRYQAGDFPTFPSPVSAKKAEDERESRGYRPSPDFSRWFWNIGDGLGLWDIRDLSGVVSAQAAGYGGGSLIYANVHLRAPGEVFDGRAGQQAWPAPYRRNELDPYYDRVAHMLDVKPVPPALGLAKTRQMKRAMEKLNQGQLKYFNPPLAISGYETPGTQTPKSADGTRETAKENPWGRMQDTCDLRGYCWMGCNRQAKNTLDLNYLAIVEDQTRTDEKGNLTKEKLADIRTLAEVTTIRRDEDSGEFEVTYKDHLRAQESVKVRARYVFLCAGAINTTELLLRNNEDLISAGSRQSGDSDTPAKNVGFRYYPNADSLATIFDCDQTQNAHVGPTITSSLLFDHGKDWFLVQDGGFPASLEPLFGIFRSPLWVRRNRYLESAPDSSEGFAARQRLTHHLSVKKTRPGAYMDLPFGTVAEAVRKLPGDIDTLVPRQLSKALSDDRKEMLDQIGKLSEERVRLMLDDLSEMIDERLDELAATLPASVRDEFEDIADFGVSRGMLRLVAQLVWGSEPDMARYVASQFADELPKDRASLIQFVMAIVRWAMDYRAINDRVSLLLTMGRDRHPGKLYLKENPRRSGRNRVTLHARLPGPFSDTSRITQERSLRDIASIAWQGELRTNPAWTFMRRRFTVHSQGGCAMGDDELDSVTDPSGEVHGCRGLYVMDAAAFPTSVGVNPSATIAAVAERKIETFIKKELNQDKWQAKPPAEEIDKWLREKPHGYDGKTNKQLLDPIPDAVGGWGDPGPATRAVGIAFSESMEGFHDGGLSSKEPGSTLWTTPAKKFTEPDIMSNTEFHSLQAVCLDAAGHGMQEKLEIEVKLEVEIEDLMRFLECYAAVENEYGNDGDSTYDTDQLIEISRIPVTGKIRISEYPEQGQNKFVVEDDSYLWLYPNALGGHDVDQSLMKYRLNFSAEISGKRERLELNGVKVLQNQPGFDVWQDTSTLYFEIERVREREKLLSGILRLHAEELLVGQLQSFETRHTSDPARQSWALAAFFKFFSDQLSKIYVPEVEQLWKVLKNVMTRTHG